MRFTKIDILFYIATAGFFVFLILQLPIALEKEAKFDKMRMLKWQNSELASYAKH